MAVEETHRTTRGSGPWVSREPTVGLAQLRSGTVEIVACVGKLTASPATRYRSTR